MKKNSKDVTFRETMHLHLRGIQDINKYCPGLFLSGLLSTIVSAAIPYVTIYLSAQIINELANLRRPDILWTWTFITLITEALLYLIKSILQHWYQALNKMFYNLQEGIFTDKMLDMDFPDIDRQETHDLRAQIAQSHNWNGFGISKVNRSFVLFVESCTGIISALVLTVSLFTLPVPESAHNLVLLNHPIFILGFLIIMGVAIIITPSLLTKANSYIADSAEEGRFGNRLFGAFSSLGLEQSRSMDCRMYDQQDIAIYYLKNCNAFGRGSHMARLCAGKVGILTGLSAGLSTILTGIIYLFVCLKALGGAFGVGSVTQYVGAITALSRNVSSLLQIIGDLKTNVPFMRMRYEFLDIPNSMYQGSLTTEKRADRQYNVEFKDVSFKYPGSEIWALRHVNMTFKVGSRMAIVGENGSGKTTFIKLLCRLYDPQEGQILLNGIDIRKYNYRDYMNVFAVVFQDYQLLSQPLGANVAGSVDYDHERVNKCLIDAGFGDRLKTLPNGLDTYLYKDFGEDGVEVSGGEAQKIAIARALYKNAPFIILDEPTAALDPIAEAEIYSKFNDIVDDKTAIYISHRLSSCKFCDEIAVFHEGTIIQQGTHEKLVAEENGKYYELWNAQAQYYTEK